MPDFNQDVMTTSSAAKRLGVNASRVRQFVLAGRIKAIKVGRDLLISADEIKRFIKEDRDRRKTRWQRERGKP